MILKRRFYILPLFLVLSFNLLLANSTTDSIKSLTADSNYKWDKISINFGGFLSELDNSIVLGSQELGLGIAINLEDALGLETSEFVFRSDAEFMYGKRDRHNLRFEYLGFFRRSTKVIESELELGGITFPIGTKIESKFDLQIIRASYSYSYFTDERIRLGASIGLFIMPINFYAQAGTSNTSAADFTAPLPVLGFNFNFAITPKVLIKQSMEFLYVQLDGFQGRINDLNFMVEYNPWKHIGFGLGYNSFLLDLRVPKDSNTSLDFVGNIKSTYTGIILYGRVRF